MEFTASAKDSLADADSERSALSSLAMVDARLSSETGFDSSCVSPVVINSFVKDALSASEFSVSRSSAKLSDFVSLALPSTSSLSLTELLSNSFA